jgi:hypothetical protein
MLDVPPRGARSDCVTEEGRGVSKTETAAPPSTEDDSMPCGTELSNNDVRAIASFYLTTFCDFEGWAERHMQNYWKKHKKRPTSTETTETQKKPKVDPVRVTAKDVARRGRAAFERHEILPLEPMKDFLMPFVYDPERFMARVERIILDGRKSRKVFTTTAYLG